MKIGKNIKPYSRNVFHLGCFVTSEDPLRGQNPGWTFISLQPGRKDGNPSSLLPSVSPRISNGMFSPMCYPGICIMDTSDAQMLFTC